MSAFSWVIFGVMVFCSLGACALYLIEEEPSRKTAALSWRPPVSRDDWHSVLPGSCRDCGMEDELDRRRRCFWCAELQSTRPAPLLRGVG